MLPSAFSVEPVLADPLLARQAEEAMDRNMAARLAAGVERSWIREPQLEAAPEAESSHKLGL